MIIARISPRPANPLCGAAVSRPDASGGPVGDPTAPGLRSEMIVTSEAGRRRFLTPQSFLAFFSRSAPPSDSRTLVIPPVIGGLMGRPAAREGAHSSAERSCLPLTARMRLRCRSYLSKPDKVQPPQPISARRSRRGGRRRFTGEWRPTLCKVTRLFAGHIPF